jgi:hypothetical protein
MTRHIKSKSLRKPDDRDISTSQISLIFYMLAVVVRLVPNKIFSSIESCLPTKKLETRGEFSIFANIVFFRFFSDFYGISLKKGDF